MKHSLGTHGDMFYSGTWTETDIHNYLVVKRRLRELVLPVPLLLDIYPHIVSGLFLVLYLDI